MFCHKCGTKNSDNAKFCAHCGEKLIDVAQSNQAQPEQPVEQPAQPEQANAQANPQQPTQPQAQPFQPQPVQPQPYETIPDFNYAQPAAPKGCFAQAFSDVMQNFGVLAKVALIPAGIALASIVLLLIPFIGPLLGVCGLVCAAIASVCAMGYAIQWGREAAGTFGFDHKSMPFNTPSFSLGFFGDAVTKVFAALGMLPIILVVVVAIIASLGAASAYGYGSSSDPSLILLQMGGIVVLAIIAAIVLSIFTGMFAQAAVMHMAICNKVDEVFNIVKLWRGFREKGKLFCAAVLPGWVFGIASAVLTTIVMAIAGGSLFSAARYSSYGYSDPTAGLGSIAIAFALCLFIALFAEALKNLVTNRAVAYWVARYNPSWGHEDHLLGA